jgi:O-antigen/teichoic acid export membrane protein
MSATARHLLRSTASNAAGQVVTMLVWFGLTPFIVDELGTVAYGLWALVGSLVAYGNLLDLGVGAAVTKFVAELGARGRWDDAGRLVATALRVYMALGLVAILAAIPLALWLPDLLDLEPEVRDDAAWVIGLTGVWLGVTLPSTNAYAILRGLQRYDAINVIGVAATLTQALATVLVLVLGGGVVGLAAIAIPLTLLWQIPMLRMIRRFAPQLPVGVRGADRAMLRMVAGFSSSLMVINGAGVVKTKTDELVIAGALPVAAVGPYAIARRLSELPGQVAYSFVRVLMPLASHLHGRDDPAGLRALFVGSTRVALALFAPVGLGLMVLGEPFLTAWVGAEFAEDWDVLLLLVPASFAATGIWPAISMLQASNVHRRTAVIAAASAALNLGLSIALVGGMGVNGVALGTLVATVLEALVVFPLALRFYRVGLSTFAAEVLGPALLPVVPATAALLALRHWLEPASIPAIAIAGLLGALVYGAAYLAFPATGEERRTLARLARASSSVASRRST